MRCSMALNMIWVMPAMGADLEFTEQAFDVPLETQQILMLDVDNDGLNDLLAILDNRLRIYQQNPDGFDFAAGFVDIEVAGQAVGWNISAGLNDAGRTEILTLVDGHELIAWTLDASGQPDPTTILTNLPGFISKGLNRLHFTRDVNGDNLDDLIIPGAEELHLYLNRGGLQFADPVTVQSDFRIRTNLQSDNLEGRTGQAIRIPVLELRDLNNDGRDDLISRTEASLQVFLSNPAGPEYFPAQASYALNIAEIEERLGGFDIDNLDFSNLTGLLALTHEEILDDVNNDGIADLLLREGGKVSVFVGTQSGMSMEQPIQVLRSGGNVLSTFLYDEDEDGRKDLWLWRVEPISVGDIFVWLALSGSVAVEAFIYPNEGERFARRPARRITVDLKFPSVIRLATSVSEIADEMRSSDTAIATPSAVGEVDGSGNRADLLVLMGNQLDIFFDAIDPETGDTVFLSSLDYSRTRNNYEIDIREVIGSIDMSGNARLQNVSGQTADMSLALESAVNNGDVMLADVNSDGLDDVFLITGEDSSHIKGILLTSIASGMQ